MAIQFEQSCAPVVSTPPLTTAKPFRQMGDFSHLAHHLNSVSRGRVPSPLKDILHYMTVDGMISLAGGLPHPDFFPFKSLEVQAYKSDTRVEPGAPEPETIPLTVRDTAESPLLTTVLQYGVALGNSSLRSILHSFTSSFYQPGYPEFEIILNSGNTEGWAKVVDLLLEPGDFVLVEEHTYPTAQSLWRPMGCRGVPVKMDGEGMVPSSLESILNGWDDEKRRGRKPKVMYIVPVGQNPTGTTMPASRKREIYQICRKHDVIICEDDPYYFLQMPVYRSPSEREESDATDASLSPSFLKFDEDGRVIRLESFSKTIAPGSRLGYFVCNPLFAERLVRATEVVSQTPSGWSQAIILELLRTWGTEGYLQWLSHLRSSYTVRRNWMCDALGEYFDLERLSSGVETYGYLKSHSTSSERKPILSFVPPTSGMFVYVKVLLDQNPAYHAILADTKSAKTPEEEWVTKTWKELADAKVLVTPGTYYVPFEDPDVPPTAGEKGVGYFRLAFSYVDKPEMTEGIRRLADAFEKMWP